MKKDLKEPCKNCPFLRSSPRGYLGMQAGEEFLDCTMKDMSMPCHMTVDYREKDWAKNITPEGNAQQCAGAAIFFSNMAKLSRDPNRLKLPGNSKDVFTWPWDFLKHHLIEH